ncbi:hypothetical protein Patl1_10653 [Pistacia atlantica]|uniref:Uncharacterized protein n=1 Tax=Pistacia atlantica TaxID=434234 RepID=A0ACC1A7K8_9ROSI|nr:hypothetical protein Patl1_10653 [Pistacia atlantica]
MMVELFVLGCTGIVVFLHGANFFFHVLSQHLAVRSLSSFLYINTWQDKLSLICKCFRLVSVFWDLLAGRPEEEE